MAKCNVEKLKALREYLGLSLNAFGRGIGYTGKQISRYENGISPIPDEVVNKIIEVYEVKKDYFKNSAFPLEDAVALPDYEKERSETARRITERRLECGLNQKKLAELCSCSETKISQIEHSKIAVTSLMAATLSRVLEVGIDWLLKGDESRKNYPEDGKLREWLWKHEDVRKELWERMESE